MSDYARAGSGGATHFGDKDALTTGDSSKVIVGTQFDAEFNAILTAVNTKLDFAGDAASLAEAVAETSNAKVITPLSIGYWSDGNCGALGDIQDLTIAGFGDADAIFGWDDSEDVAIGFTLGDGLATTTTVLHLEHLGLEDLEDPDAESILYWDDTDGALNWLTMGTGLAFDQGTDTLLLSFLGIEALTDPDADRIFFWDDVAGAAEWLIPGNGVEIDNASLTLGLVDVDVATDNPVVIASGAVTLDLEGLTTIKGSALAATDTFLVDDGGTPKGLEYQDMGLIVLSSQVTQPTALTDANTIMEYNGTATYTISPDATTDLPIGSCIVIIVDHATQVVTVTADTGVTLNSIFHPSGALAASDTVMAGGTAVLVKVAADEWYLSGNITT